MLIKLDSMKIEYNRTISNYKKWNKNIGLIWIEL